MTDPLITLLLLTYNQETMVRAAALACLAQEGGPYEIIFSDDASTDGTYAVLREVAAAYRGPHQVVVRRSVENVGIGEHYNQLIELARGELLVTAAGDDLSVPTRVAELAAAWEATGRQADLVSSHLVDFDHDGHLHDVIHVDDLAQWRSIDDWVEKRPYIVGAAHAFTKRMMKHFGPMHTGIAYEDQIMTFRALMLGGGVIVDKPLVHYRRGGTSRLPVFESAKHALRWRNRQDSREYCEAVQLIADAEKVGHTDEVCSKVGRSLLREGYKHDLRSADTLAQRWALFRRATTLPLGWRFRKLLHAAFPMVSFTIKQQLAHFHRRERRRRREERAERAARALKP